MSKFIIGIFLCCIILGQSCKNKLNKEKVSCVSSVYQDSIQIRISLDGILSLTSLDKGNIIFEHKIYITEGCMPPEIGNNGILYFLSKHNTISAVELKTGEKQWHYDAQGKIKKLIKIKDDIIVARVSGSGLQIIKDGLLIKTISESGIGNCNQSINNEWIIYDEHILVADFKCATVLSINTIDWSTNWSFNSGFNGLSKLNRILGQVAVFTSSDVNGLNGKLSILDKDNGELKLSENVDFDLIVDPIVYHGSIIFYNSKNQICQFFIDTKKTKVLHQFRIGNGLCLSNIYLVGDELFFTDCEYSIGELNLISSEYVDKGTAPKILTDVYELDGEIVFSF